MREREREKKEREQRKICREGKDKEVCRNLCSRKSKVFFMDIIQLLHGLQNTCFFSSALHTNCQI